jgi:uncharacterized ferritin-like protein (DUF455 family)
LNPRPLDEVDHYGLARRRVDLLGFTRGDLAAHFGV